MWRMCGAGRGNGPWVVPPVSIPGGAYGGHCPGRLGHPWGMEIRIGCCRIFSSALSERLSHPPTAAGCDRRFSFSRGLPRSHRRCGRSAAVPGGCHAPNQCRSISGQAVLPGAGRWPVRCSTSRTHRSLFLCHFPVFSLRDILEKSALPRIASRRKGNAPICCLANEIDALAGKEIRAILDFINRILYGTVIAKRSVGKIEVGQVQNSDAVAAMTAKNTCHCAYITHPLHLLCKRTSAVRRDGTHRFDMVLKVIVYFLYCRAARLQQRGPRRQIPKNYPPSCEKRKFPSCGKFGKM